MKFKGDIIITDPCYISNGPNDLWDKNDVDTFSGAGIEKYGFTQYIWEDTIYGDWSCSTLQLKDSAKGKSIENIKKTDIEKQIGNFCADAGLVGVFLLEEVLKHNPNFDYHLTRPDIVTLIKDFDGNIRYEIVDGEQVHIVGKGNVNFITTQSGF